MLKSQISFIKHCGWYIFLAFHKGTAPESSWKTQWQKKVLKSVPLVWVWLTSFTQGKHTEPNMQVLQNCIKHLSVVDSLQYPVTRTHFGWYQVLRFNMYPLICLSAVSIKYSCIHVDLSCLSLCLFPLLVVSGLSLHSSHPFFFYYP